MQLNKGDYCILKGNYGSDVCVRIVGELEPWNGTARFMGEKINVNSKRVVVRRAFFKDEILKVIKGLPKATNQDCTIGEP